MMMMLAICWRYLDGDGFLGVRVVGGNIAGRIGTLLAIFWRYLEGDGFLGVGVGADVGDAGGCGGCNISSRNGTAFTTNTVLFGTIHQDAPKHAF